MSASTDPPARVKVSRFPAFGVLLAALTLVVECWTIAGLIHVGGVFPPLDLLLAFTVFVALFGGLDLMVQLVLPGMGLALIPRAALVVGIAYGIMNIIQVQVSFTILSLAAVWTVAQIYCAALWARFLPFRWVTLVPAATFAAFFFLSSVPQPPAEPAPPLRAESVFGPSFLVVVLDTVRADHTSTYGYGRATTPALDLVAARGTRFERAYSTSSWTLPSHASLFSGLLPEQHGAHLEHFFLEPEVLSLPGLLASRGYATAFFSASPIASAGTGLTRGFHHVEEFWRPSTTREILTGYRIFQRIWPLDRDKGGNELVANALQWLERRDPSRPFFLFVNLFEAHAPYQVVPERSRRAFVPTGASSRQLELVGTLGFLAQVVGDPFPDRYHQQLTDLLDGAIAAADSYLSRLIDAVGDDVVVIVLSDHGDLIGEHDRHGHGFVLWEPLIRVPLVMAGPGIPSGKVVEEPVSIIDVMPTVLGMADVPAPSLPGADLRKVIAGEGEAKRMLYAQQYRAATPMLPGWGRHYGPTMIRNLQSRKAAAILGAWKRIIAEDGTDVTFDLTADPAEGHPIRAARVDLPVQPPRPTTGRPVRTPTKPGTAEALRALGYVR